MFIVISFFWMLVIQFQCIKILPLSESSTVFVIPLRIVSSYLKPSKHETRHPKIHLSTKYLSQTSKKQILTIHQLLKISNKKSVKLEERVRRKKKSPYLLEKSDILYFILNILNEYLRLQTVVLLSTWIVDYPLKTLASP